MIKLLRLLSIFFVMILFLHLFNCEVQAKNVLSPLYSDAKYTPYNNDLSMVEEALFGKTYKTELDTIRLERIENRLYNKTYNSLSLSRRMNRILSDYNYNNYYTGNYYCQPKNTIINKVKNALIGYPTGYTPQIEPSPYLNTYGPSYMRGFYGNNGWNSHNIYNPVYSGAGVHILN